MIEKCETSFMKVCSNQRKYRRLNADDAILNSRPTKRFQFSSVSSFRSLFLDHYRQSSSRAANIHVSATAFTHLNVTLLDSSLSRTVEDLQLHKMIDWTKEKLFLHSTFNEAVDVFGGDLDIVKGSSKKTFLSSRPNVSSSEHKNMNRWKQNSNQFSKAHFSRISIHLLEIHENNFTSVVRRVRKRSVL